MNHNATERNTRKQDQLQKTSKKMSDNMQAKRERIPWKD